MSAGCECGSANCELNMNGFVVVFYGENVGTFSLRARSKGQALQYADEWLNSAAMTPKVEILKDDRIFMNLRKEN